MHSRYQASRPAQQLSGTVSSLTPSLDAHVASGGAQSPRPAASAAVGPAPIAPHEGTLGGGTGLLLADWLEALARVSELLRGLAPRRTDDEEEDYAAAAAAFSALLTERLLPLTVLAAAEGATDAAAAHPACATALRSHVPFLLRLYAHYSGPCAALRRAASQAARAAGAEAPAASLPPVDGVHLAEWQRLCAEFDVTPSLLSRGAVDAVFYATARAHGTDAAAEGRTGRAGAGITGSGGSAGQHSRPLGEGLPRAVSLADKRLALASAAAAGVTIPFADDRAIRGTLAAKRRGGGASLAGALTDGHRPADAAFLPFEALCDAVVRVALTAFAAPYLRERYPGPGDKVHGLLTWLLASGGVFTIEAADWARGRTRAGVPLRTASLAQAAAITNGGGARGGPGGAAVGETGTQFLAITHGPHRGAQQQQQPLQQYAAADSASPTLSATAPPPPPPLSVSLVTSLSSPAARVATMHVAAGGHLVSPRDGRAGLPSDIVADAHGLPSPRQASWRDAAAAGGAFVLSPRQTEPPGRFLGCPGESSLEGGHQQFDDEEGAEEEAAEEQQQADEEQQEQPAHEATLEELAAAAASDADTAAAPAAPSPALPPLPPPVRAPPPQVPRDRLDWALQLANVQLALQAEQKAQRAAAAGGAPDRSQSAVGGGSSESGAGPDASEAAETGQAPSSPPLLSEQTRDLMRLLHGAMMMGGGSGAKAPQDAPGESAAGGGDWGEEGDAAAAAEADAMLEDEERLQQQAAQEEEDTAATAEAEGEPQQQQQGGASGGYTAASLRLGDARDPYVVGAGAHQQQQQQDWRHPPPSRPLLPAATLLATHPATTAAAAVAAGAPTASDAAPPPVHAGEASFYARHANARQVWWSMGGESLKV